jgi:hypothetical protein
MKRFASILVLNAVFAGASAESAHAGGTLVLGPDEASEADCEPGAEPQIEGVRLPTLIVLGCVAPEGSAPVVLAADESYAFACFYVSPPNASNQGPCTQVHSVGRSFGGPLTARKRSLSPVTGGDVISSIQIGTHGGETYVSGHAPANASDVFVSPGHHNEEGPWFDRAALYKVPLSLGARIGATHPFSIFVARVSPRLDTCEGIHLVAHTDDGPLSADVAKGDQAYPGRSVPLPRTKNCTTSGALDIARAVASLVEALPLRTRGA